MAVSGGGEVKVLGTNGEVAHGFTAYVVDELGLTFSTAFTYLQNVARIERFVERDAMQIGVPELRRFLRQSPYHPSTKSASLVGFKAWHRFAVLEGLRDDLSVQAMRGPKLVRSPKEALTTEEARAVLAVDGPSVARACWLGLYAGLRISEAARIDAEAWRHPDKLRFVGKGRKIREVPVHEELLEKRDWILDHPMSANAMKHVVRAVSYYVDVPFTSHTLRRTFAQHLVEAGVAREVIGELLGHAQGVTVTAYAPITWREKVEAIESLDYGEDG